MGRALGLGIALALVLLVAPAALAANSPPKLTPIKAVFVQKAFATNYSASATDPDGDKLTLSWQLSATDADPKCNKFATVTPTKAIWHHGDKDGCNHAVQGPRGHKGIVHFYVSDGTWICTEQYDGTITGTGGAGACLKSVPPAAKYTCTGNQIKLFDNSNGGGVLNGAKPPSFSTKGQGVLPSLDHDVPLEQRAGEGAGHDRPHRQQHRRPVQGDGQLRPGRRAERELDGEHQHAVEAGRHQRHLRVHRHRPGDLVAEPADGRQGLLHRLRDERGEGRPGSGTSTTTKSTTTTKTTTTTPRAAASCRSRRRPTPATRR